MASRDRDGAVDRRLDSDGGDERRGDDRRRGAGRSPEVRRL
jgi:hypothetical protein